MKKPIIIVILLFFAAFHLHSQETNLNQEKPLNKHPGKTLKLKEVLRITDDQGEFFFRFPHNMCIAPNEDIFAMDYHQLLRFDKHGKLLNNYFKEGQGPGELVSMKNYILSGDSVIILNVRPHKILQFKKQGTLVNESRIHENFFSGILLAFRNNNYYIVTYGPPVIKGNSGFADSMHNLIEISSEGNKLRTLASFPVRTFVVMFDGGRASSAMAKFICKVRQNRYLVFSHTEEYEIKIYDLEKTGAEGRFSRKYKRVKPKRTSDDDAMLQGKVYRELKREYTNDIEGIFVLTDKIWAVTSTENKKGRLIDVFGYDGNYLDNFYVKLKGTIMAARDGYILVREQNKHGAAEIVKYLLNF